MKLLHDYVLVRVDETPETSKGGLLLTENTRRLPNTGVVEAVGPQVNSVEVGHSVVFLRYASIDGPEENIRICKEEQIVGIKDAPKRT